LALPKHPNAEAVYESVDRAMGAFPCSRTRLADSVTCGRWMPQLQHAASRGTLPREELGPLVSHPRPESRHECDVRTVSSEVGGKRRMEREGT
jgi:hypothetical protein